MRCQASFYLSDEQTLRAQVRDLKLAPWTLYPKVKLGPSSRPAQTQAQILTQAEGQARTWPKRKCKPKPKPKLAPRASPSPNSSLAQAQDKPKHMHTIKFRLGPSWGTNPSSAQARTQAQTNHNLKPKPNSSSSCVACLPANPSPKPLRLRSQRRTHCFVEHVVVVASPWNLCSRTRHVQCGNVRTWVMYPWSVDC